MNEMRGNISLKKKAWKLLHARLRQLRYPALVEFSCPNCGKGIPNFRVNIGVGERWTFLCPTCGCRLCLSPTYSRSVMLGCGVLSLAVCSILAVWSWLLCLAAVVPLWILLGFISGLYVKIVFPPAIMRYYSSDVSLSR